LTLVLQRQSKSVAFEEFSISQEKLQRYISARGRTKLRELEKDRQSTIYFNGTVIETQGPPEEAAAVHADVVKLLKAWVCFISSSCRVTCLHMNRLADVQGPHVLA